MAPSRRSGALAPSSLLSFSDTHDLNKSWPGPADSSSGSTSISPFLRILNLFSYLLDERGLDGLITNLAALYDSNFTGTSPLIGVGHHFVAYASPLEPADRARTSNAEIFCLKVPNISSRTSRDELYHTILQELRALCHPSLSEHENIINLLGLDFQEDYDDYQLVWPVIAMEYADYGSLDDYQQNVLLDHGITCELLLDIALGLDALHRCNVIHGDVKSENVLICRHPTRKVVAKLSDFGLAIINPTSDNLYHLPGGTWPWTAPESRQRLSIKGLQLADVFSYGLTVWRILVNKSNPFDLLNRNIVDDPTRLSPEEFVGQAKLSSGFAESVIRTLRPSSRSILIAEFAESVLRSTTQTNPENRDMMKAISALAAYSTRYSHGPAERALSVGQDYWDREDPYAVLVTLHQFFPVAPPSLYAKQCVLRTFLHDLRQLVDSGTKTAAIACSICFRIAVDPQFQVGDKSKEECCRLLSRACELGLTSYRGIMHRFFEVMSQPITVDLGKEWLMEAADCGSFFAIDSLRADFPALYRQYQHKVVSDTLSTWLQGRLGNANSEEADSNGDSKKAMRNRDVLLTYCRSGNYSESRKLLIQGSSAIPESGDGVTPLHWLVSFHAEEEIEDLAGLMLNNGALLASWECETENDFWLGKAAGTPLLWAVWYRNIHAVRTLTRLDQNPEPDNVNGAFILAATMHFFDILEILLLWFAKIQQNNLGAALDVGSLLEGAADGAFFIQRLLRHGFQFKDFAMRATFDLLLAIPSLPSGHMMNLTNRAIIFNNPSLLVYLLRRQSPAERLRNVKDSTILYPIIRGYWDVFSTFTEDEFRLIHANSYLATSGPQETRYYPIQLPVIARQRDLAYLKRIIQLGCPVDQKSDKPKPTATAFVIAVMNGLFDSATLLLRCGANKDQLCGYVMGGTTPTWHLLLHWPDVPISRLQYLLEEVPKAGFGHVNFVGWPSVGGNLVYPFAMTPWANYKAGFRISETLKYLLSRLRDKSYLDRIDKIGMTALSTAAMNGNVEVCQSLLEMGVDVNNGAIAPLNRAQDFLKQFQKREKEALSKGSYGERKLAIHIRKRAETVVNMLLARGARNSNTLDLIHHIASGNMRLPPAEFLFQVGYAAMDRSVCSYPGTFPLHPSTNSEFTIFRANYGKLFEAFTSGGQFVDQRRKHFQSLGSLPSDCDNPRRPVDTMGRHCGPWFPCPYATHADLGHLPLTPQMQHAVHELASPPRILHNAPEQRPVSHCLAPPARISTHQGGWDTTIPSHIPNYHDHYNLGTPISPNTPNYQASATHNERSVHRYVRPSTNIPVSDYSAPFLALGPPSTLPFRNNLSSPNNEAPPSTIQQHPEALMRRLNDLIFAFHDHGSKTPKDAQSIAKLLKREFEAPIQLVEPCRDANDCAVLQDIVSWVPQFGFEERELSLVPMVSEDGKVLTIFVAGET